MLVTAPAICASMGVFMSPSACSTFVQTLSQNSPTDATHTIRPYTITSRITSGESENMAA